MTAYYNEIDPKAAAVLRELIKAGHIAPGVVDERSIEDVVPAELMGYTQCHFFAGFGVWSYALRRAGWDDSRAIWTGSCPCQPFSSAGKGAGFADQRHLWPSFLHLISECKPPIIAGEQVASKDADPWIDLVQADLEALDHAFGAVAFPSAGIGAPHIRDRTYWVANANDTRSQGRSGVLERSVECATRPSSVASRVGYSQRLRARWDARASACAQGGVALRSISDDIGSPSAIGGMAYAGASGWDQQCGELGKQAVAGQRRNQFDDGGEFGEPGPTNGLWRDADWLLCRDGKWRPVEPGTFPLAHGAAARVGRLRGYGNAINAEAAKAFIEAVMEAA